jgi:hypothetical protein
MAIVRPGRMSLKNSKDTIGNWYLWLPVLCSRRCSHSAVIMLLHEDGCFDGYNALQSGSSLPTFGTTCYSILIRAIRLHELRPTCKKTPIFDNKHCLYSSTPYQLQCLLKGQSLFFSQKNRQKNKFIKRSRLTSFRRHIYVPDPLLFMFISRLVFILYSKLTGVMTAKKTEYELPHTYPSIFPLSLGTSVRSVVCQHDEERSSVQLSQDRIPTKSAMNKKPELLISK